MVAISTSPQPTDIKNEYDEEPIDLTQQLIQMADEARKQFTDAKRQLRDIELEVTTCLQCSW